MSKDEYYQSPAARYDTIIGDDKTIKLWMKIRRARNEFDGEQLNSSFHNWLIDKYGIKMNISSDEEINLKCDIVNEQKYMVFVLKYSGDA